MLVRPQIVFIRDEITVEIIILSFQEKIIIRRNSHEPRHTGFVEDIFKT